MGLLSFVKDAGEKLFNWGDDSDVASKLTEVTASMGINAADVKAAYLDGTATLTGSMNDHTQKEKLVLLVGNTNGIEKVEDQIQVASTEAASDFYTVKSGDSLSKIAKEVYGDAMKYPVLFEANKPMLAHPDKIFPGQVLRVPAIS